ncbi:MAG TPA: D-alanine--D-alanine ligase family protein [Candidatus Saccharimonadales bacterium]|nr:D-alanine--D-alanine ligase family protein [Candidatus Saccharimonadales bacterium]
MKTIAVIFGGRSAEHDVSIVTAIASIIRPLELTKKYRVEAVYIAKNGAWFWDDKLKDIQLYSSGDIERFTARTQPASVQFDGGMTLVKASGLAGRKRHQQIDIAFPAMHGTYGEDGALMGLLDMAGLPYVGCGLDAGVLTMNKILAKEVAVAHGVPVSKFLSFSGHELEQDPAAAAKRITKELKFPLFVKPAHLGSSIGISRATQETELRNGLEVAAKYDDAVIVEEAVPNLIEVTLPILGNTELTPAYLEQPLTQPEDFFDFDTKYMKGGKGGKKMGGAAGAGKVQGASNSAQGYSTIPAKLPKDLYDKAEQTGLNVYRALNCAGTARVDMLIDGKTGKVYFNEVNPLPGSLYAHNWAKKGISNVELVTRLVELAESRFRARQSLSTVFSTNFLKQF